MSSQGRITPPGNPYAVTSRRQANPPPTGPGGLDPKSPGFLFSATVQSFLGRGDPSQDKTSSPFFATLLFSTTPVWSTDVSRAATDGKKIYLRQEWFVSQKPAERRGALLHEVLHCAFLHIPRGRGRDRALFNKAGDIVINGVIDDYYKDARQFVVLPENVVRRDDLKHLPAEEIYEILLQEKKSIEEQRKQQKQDQDQGEGEEEGEGEEGEGEEGEGEEGEGEEEGQCQSSGGQPCGSSGGGGGGSQNPTKKSRGFDIPAGADEDQFWGSQDPEAGHDCTIHKHGKGDGEGEGKEGKAHGEEEEFTEEEMGEMEAFWKQAQARAINAAQQSGTFGRFGANSLRQLDYVLNPPTVDWLTLLYQRLTTNNEDYTGPFLRSGISRGLYIETLVTESLKLYVCVDTSGSIDDKLLAKMISEIIGILERFPHIEGQLFFCDTDLYGPFPLQDAPVIQAKGGGGTSFIPFFEYPEIQNGAEGDGVLLYITDGYGAFPSTPPQMSTIWAIVPGGIEDKNIPFGEVVHILPSQLGDE